MLTATNARNMIQRMIPTLTIDVRPFDRRWEAVYIREGGTDTPLAYDATLGNLVEQVRERLEKKQHTWPIAATKRAEWGIFASNATDFAAAEAIEAGYLSPEEAEAAIERHYRDEDVTVHVVEESDADPQQPGGLREQPHEMFG